MNPPPAGPPVSWGLSYVSPKLAQLLISALVAGKSLSEAGWPENPVSLLPGDLHASLEVLLGSDDEDMRS